MTGAETIALIGAARNVAQARKYLDRYAAEHDLSREEAIKRLSKQAQKAGKRSAVRALRDYEAHLRWRRKHPVKGALATVVDPTGLGGLASRSTKRWLRHKPH
jgi:hypothetical protein